MQNLFRYIGVSICALLLVAVGGVAFAQQSGFDDFGGSIFDSVSLDLKVNGQDGPVTVAAGSRIVVSWISEGAARCRGNWSKNDIKSSGTVAGRLSRSVVIKAACIDKEGNRDDDLVVVNVEGKAQIAPQPTTDTPASTSDKTSIEDRFRQSGSVLLEVFAKEIADFRRTMQDKATLVSYERETDALIAYLKAELNKTREELLVAIQRTITDAELNRIDANLGDRIESLGKEARGRWNLIKQKFSTPTTSGQPTIVVEKGGFISGAPKLEPNRDVKVVSINLKGINAGSTGTVGPITGIVVELTGTAPRTAFAGAVTFNDTSPYAGPAIPFNSNNQATIPYTTHIPDWNSTLTLGVKTASDIQAYAGKSFGLMVVALITPASVRGSLPISGETYTIPTPTTSAQPSVLNVIYPKQGDVLQAGKQVRIDWGANVVEKTQFNIVLFDESGKGFLMEGITPEQAGCPGVGKGVCSWLWTPNKSSTRTQIAITISNTDSIVYSGYFTITAPTTSAQPTITGTITVTSPKDGEVFSQENAPRFTGLPAIPINWTSTGIAANEEVSVDIQKKGEDSKEISKRIRIDSNTLYIVLSQYAPGTYQIRVTLWSNPKIVAYSGVFTISAPTTSTSGNVGTGNIGTGMTTPPSLSATAPTISGTRTAAGDKLYPGSMSITATISNSGGQLTTPISARFQYSPNNGNNWYDFMEVGPISTTPRNVSHTWDGGSGSFCFRLALGTGTDNVSPSSCIEIIPKEGAFIGLSRELAAAGVPDTDVWAFVKRWLGR